MFVEDKADGEWHKENAPASYWPVSILEAIGILICVSLMNHFLVGGIVLGLMGERTLEALAFTVAKLLGGGLLIVLAALAMRWWIDTIAQKLHIED